MKNIESSQSPFYEQTSRDNKTAGYINMSGGLVYVILLTSGHLSTMVAGVNLAYNKPANQSGAVSNAHGNYTADRAVDGKFEPTSVAIPDASQVNYTDHAVWWVDLEDTYRVLNITIYNADGTGRPEFLNYFILSVGPDLSSRTDCGPEWTKNIIRGGHVTIQCNQVGRIVHFRRTGNGPGPNQVPLREVEVYGIEQYSCAPCPPGTPCDADNGCTQCAPGKLQSPECEQNCSVGTYGLNCLNQCGQCAQPEDCSIVDGDCSGGCRTPWWVHEKCDKEVVVPNWTDETVMITDSTNSSLTITLQQIQSLDPELYEYYGYLVLYKNATSPSYSGGPQSKHSETGNISTVLIGLSFYQEYDTKIVPYRTNSEEHTYGTPYPVTSAKTSCGYPDPPSDVRTLPSYSEGQSIILVSWNDITGPDVMHRCESMMGLGVDFRLVGDADWIQENIGITNTLHGILPPENGEYEVRVVSINSQNFTMSSEIQTVITAGSSIDVTIIVSVVVVTVGVVAIVIVVTFLVIRDRRHRDDKNRENTHSNNCIIYENEDVVADLKLRHKESTRSRDPLEHIPDEAKYEALNSGGQLPDPMFNVYDKIHETPYADPTVSRNK